METWLKERGATGLDDLHLADFPITGRGIKTQKPFKQGESILTIPSACLWTVARAHADSILGPALRSITPPPSTEDTLAIYILFVRSRKSGYNGQRDHVAVLPANYSSSIFFTEEELEVCAGSSLYTLTKQLEQRIQDDYTNLVRVLHQHTHIIPPDEFTIQDYKWALCTVWSRAMDFALPNGESIRLIAPYADMLNHSPQAKQCHAYTTSSGDLSVLAGKDYDPGDQVFINYGTIPNNRLLRLYGFIIPDNPNNSYDLILTTHPMAPFFEQKQQLWASANLDSTSTITLTLTDPLPTAVLQYLRIQRLDASDLVTSLQTTNKGDTKISDSNEAEVLQFLVDSITSLLNSFATPLDMLEEQLAKGFYPPGGNAWAAAHVSMGEQRVLRMTLKKVQDLLAALEGGDSNSQGLAHRCAKCGNTSAQLMACGRCKSVRYCGRSCQVAHYKEHKAMCQAIAKKGS